MDIATYIVVCCAIMALYSLAVSSIKTRLLITASVWIFVTAAGEFLFAFAGNSTCSPYLGCVTGFMGYDAFEHLFFGVAAALAVVWLCQRYPQYSIAPHDGLREMLAIVSAVIMMAVIWEMIECAHDALRLDVLHQTLSNVRLHINLLDQPSNLDTMGDLSMTLFGAVIGFFMRPRNRR